MDFYNLLERDQDIILEMIELFHLLCPDDKPYMNYEVFYMCDLDAEDDVVYKGHEYDIHETSGRRMGYLCYKGKLNALKYLVEEKNADFEYIDSDDDENLLFDAVLDARPNVLSYLLELGLDPNHRNYEGYIPLEYLHLYNDHHREVESSESRDFSRCVDILTKYNGIDIKVERKWALEDILKDNKFIEAETRETLIKRMKCLTAEAEHIRITEDLRVIWKHRGKYGNNKLISCIRGVLVNRWSYTDEDVEIALDVFESLLFQE